MTTRGYALTLYVLLFGIAAMLALPEVLAAIHALNAMGHALQAPATP